ncbi:hypothetical protein [Allomuricauda sp. AC10]|nr:hypothetical protein [Muricauda sp. AC10]MDC6366191.1 hypothetical protein [Muricauda sp. AC10]
MPSFFSPKNITELSKLYQSKNSNRSNFELVSANEVATVYYNSSDAELIKITANLFAEDIERLTGKKPAITTSADKLKGRVVVLGTIDQNELIEKLLVKYGEPNKIKGHWNMILPSLKMKIKN